MFKFLLNKKFFIWWFVLSLCGALLSIYITNRQEKLIKNSVKCVTKLGHNNKSILIIDNSHYYSKYLSYIENDIKTLNFYFTILNEGEQIYILDTIQENGLVNIYYKKNKHIKSGIISPIFIDECDD
jgi:hypothetical protein